MNTYQLSTWALVFRVAAAECSDPISTFNDPAQALQQLYIQQVEGKYNQVITNDGELYWLVSVPLATKLYEAGFYPLPAGNQ